MKSLRWLWFAIAILSVLETPHAIVSAVAFGRRYRQLIPIIPLGFVIRFVVTWWFFKLWWDSRIQPNTGVNLIS